jgi:hypothetical protein
MSQQTDSAGRLPKEQDAVRAVRKESRGVGMESEAPGVDPRHPESRSGRLDGIHGAGKLSGAPGKRPSFPGSCRGPKPSAGAGRSPKSRC